MNPKTANPVAVGFLSLTLVYIPFFWYRVNRELRELGEQRGIDLGDSPTKSALAMFPGALVLVPPYWTAYTTSERIKTAQIATGRKDFLEGWISIVVLLVLPPLMFGFVQDQLNKVWQNLGMHTPYETLPPPQAPPQPGGQQYAPPPPGHKPPDAPPPG